MNKKCVFDDEKMQIATMIKELRTQNGLSQRKLSELTGVGQSDICKVERGESNPSLSTIVRLLRAMGAVMTIDYRVQMDFNEFEIEYAQRLDPKYINICKESASYAKRVMKEDLEGVVLYGSCARGDNNEDSDVDIALLTQCNRISSEKYIDQLAECSASLMMKYNEIVNFVCLPLNEFQEKREWYPFFKNIWEEGILIYGRE